jgi:hypothetical protein
VTQGASQGVSGYDMSDDDAGRGTEDDTDPDED